MGTDRLRNSRGFIAVSLIDAVFVLTAACGGGADLPTRVIDMRDELGLNFPVIADPIYVVASDWLVFDIDNDGKSNPASFVLDAHSNLIARMIAAEPTDRPSVYEVLNVIEESLIAGIA